MKAIRTLLKALRTLSPSVRIKMVLGDRQKIDFIVISNLLFFEKKERKGKMPGRSYIPAKEADFVDWSVNLITVAKAHKNEWKLDDGQLTPLESLIKQVKDLHEKCQTAEYTPLDMKSKNELKTSLKAKLETFVRNNLQNNDAMTDNGRADLRITIRDKSPTPHPAPQTVPEIETETPYPRALLIKFRDQKAERWGKAEYAVGFECRWVIAAEKPSSLADLLHSDFATKSPLELVFDEDMRGKKVFFAGRWEGNSAKKGPYSDIFEAIVP